MMGARLTVSQAGERDGQGALLLVSETRMPAAAAGRTLEQLCRHFEHGHALPVTLPGSESRVGFTAGVCTFQADADGGFLTASVAASDDAALAWLESMAGRHLEQAFRDKPDVRWTRVGQMPQDVTTGGDA